MFVALGRSADDAPRDADAVLAIETALAKASSTWSRSRDPANLYH